MDFSWPEQISASRVPVARVTARPRSPLKSFRRKDRQSRKERRVGWVRGGRRGWDAAYGFDKYPTQAKRRLVWATRDLNRVVMRF